MLKRIVSIFNKIISSNDADIFSQNPHFLHQTMWSVVSRDMNTLCNDFKKKHFLLLCFAIVLFMTLFEVKYMANSIFAKASIMNVVFVHLT